MLRYIFIATVSFISINLVAQTPYVKKFLPENYQGGYQSWELTQDSNGMIYVANNFGILQYDGIRWEKFPLANKDVAFAIRKYNDTIFVGSNNEIGYLGYDSTGMFRKYISLTHKVPKEHRKFSNFTSQKWHCIQRLVW